MPHDGADGSRGKALLICSPIMFWNLTLILFQDLKEFRTFGAAVVLAAAVPTSAVEVFGVRLWKA